MPRRVARFAFLAAVSAGAIVALIFAAQTYRERAVERAHEKQLREIIALIDLPKDADFHTGIDRVRTFINDHSRHAFDPEIYPTLLDRGRVAADLIAHAKGEAPNPVLMECSTRSNLMSRVLRALGYETRIVALFDTDHNLRSHSFLDVKNPETGAWETQDPDFDLYWQVLPSGQRVSVAEAADDLDTLVPCGRNACGWDVVGKDKLAASFLRDFLDIISVTQKESDQRYSVYTPRANLTASFRDGDRQGSYCDLNAKRCRDGFTALAPFAQQR